MKVILRIRRKNATQAEQFTLDDTYSLALAQEQVNTAIERGQLCRFIVPGLDQPVEFDPSEMDVVSVTLEAVQPPRRELR